MTKVAARAGPEQVLCQREDENDDRA